MSHTPHELADEFPEAAEQLHALKTSSAHFTRLFDEYHELNRAIHRIETQVEPASDAHEYELRRRRMALKDDIYCGLKASFRPGKAMDAEPDA